MNETSEETEPQPAPGAGFAAQALGVLKFVALVALTVAAALVATWLLQALLGVLGFSIG